MTIVKPVVPGTVIRFTGATTVTIEPSAAETIAIPLVHDWGPIYSDPAGADGRSGGVQELTSFAAWTALYGDSDTPGRTAVAGAFAGQSVPGGAGAGAVIAQRIAGSSAAAASVSISYGAGAGLVLTGKYKGSRANNFTYIVDTDPLRAGNDRLRLLYKGAVQETYSYSPADITGLAAQINRLSRMVTATVSHNGTALTHGTAPLAGGDDGATLLLADHTNALDTLDLLPFSILAPYDVTDSTTQAAYKSWIQTQRNANRPVDLVLGGAAGEVLTAALTRQAAMDDPNIFTFGVGTYHDDLLDKDLSTSQLAPRIAGIIASLGSKSDLTFKLIGGLHVVGGFGPSADDVQVAVQSGVIVLMGASSPNAELRVAKGVTTFTDSSDASRPLDVFGDIRLVRIMDQYVRDMREWGDDIVIGNMPVNDESRALVRGQARKLEDALLRDGLILPGDPTAQPAIPIPWVVCVDPHDPALADAIPYTFGWQFAQTANAILGEGQIQ